MVCDRRYAELSDKAAVHPTKMAAVRVVSLQAYNPAW